MPFLWAVLIGIEAIIVSVALAKSADSSGVNNDCDGSAS